MTKALLNIIKAEYEHTSQNIEQLCDKYNCTTKDLKGYTTWNKNILQPTKSKETETYVKLVYETLYSPTLEDIEFETESNIVSENNVASEDESNIVSEDEELDIEVVEDEEVAKDIIHKTAEQILNKQPVSKNDIPKPLQDSFEGLRKLDIKLQNQSIRILDKLDVMLLDAETPKDLRDLAAVHTSIRDVYFNTKSPMINILNGDVNMSQQSELATLLEGTSDDC